MKKYDLVVIGSGPAGEKAAVKAGYFGKHVALVEMERQLGGACLRAGLPSKALKQSALYLSGQLERQLYGKEKIAGGLVPVGRFLKRKQIVGEAMSEEVRCNLKRHRVDLYRGRAVLDDPHHVHIMGEKEEVLETDFICLAMGTAPSHPSWIPFDDPRIFDSDTISNLERLPGSLCIAGGGVIGCEYATIFATTGVPVDLIHSSEVLLPYLDGEIRQALISSIEERGVRIWWNSEVTALRTPREKSNLLQIDISNGETLHADAFFLASGRKGMTAGMGLEELSIDCDEQGLISVDETYQTVVPNIYAVGDVIGFPSLASTSMDQGRVAVSHMFQIGDLDRFQTVLPYAIYSMPEAAMVGITEEQAQAQEVDYGVSSARMDEVARGRIMEMDCGLLKLVYTKGDRVIRGVHCLAPLASEIIHYGVTLVESEQTLDHVARAVFNFPTMHEVYQLAANRAISTLKGLPLKMGGA